MRITISVILCFMVSIVYGQNTGAYLTSYSSAPLEVDFDTRQASNFEISRNFGFQLNIPIKINKIPSLICEFNLGLDSYSFDLQPYGIQRSFFIHYRGLSLGYEYRHSLKENNYLRLGGAVSFLNFLGARSSIGVQASDTRINTTALIGNPLQVVFSPKLNFDYSWQTKTLRSFRVGIVAATSVQDILNGDFIINDNGENFSGTFTKKLEFVGIQFGVNLSPTRRARIRDRISKGLLKEPKSIDNTISKLTYAFHIGTGSKIFISNPNVFAAEKPDNVNLNLSYGFDISRSIPILDKYHATLAFSYQATESTLKADYLNPNTNVLTTIDTKLNTVQVVSGGIGYNLLKNKKNKPNFFQITPQLNLNLNLINDQSISIANPEDGSPLWTLSARDEGKVFFSSQLKVDHFRKLKNNRFLRLGLSFERGRDLLVGELENSAGEFSEFYQNNFAIRFHVGIMLRSDSNKI